MTFALSINFVAEECCNCRVQFAMTRQMYDARRTDKKEFYCPNGHRQYYTGMSDLEKERQARQRAEQNVEYERQRAEGLRKRADHQERRASTFKGHCIRIKKKVGMGRCPCCQEDVTFRNLRRHMTKHHPAWSPDAEPVHNIEVVQP